MQTKNLEMFNKEVVIKYKCMNHIRTPLFNGSLSLLFQDTKYLLPTLEKELFLAEHSDLEEGGLDLTVSLKPVSFYISDKKEMLQQCFCIIGEKKLQKMLPDVLKVLQYIYYWIIHIYRNIQTPFLQ